MIGGDDILPLAPVAEHIDQFTERSHAADLRRTTQPDGSALPDDGSRGYGRPLRDADPGRGRHEQHPERRSVRLATAYDTVGGTLYVPSVAIGRLVETPDADLGDDHAVPRERRRRAGGLRPSPAATAHGRSFPIWSPRTCSGAAARTRRWATRGTRRALAETLFPADGQTADVVSINAHFDERALLPGIPNAADNPYAPDELYTATSAIDTAAISGSLLLHDRLPRRIQPPERATTARTPVTGSTCSRTPRASSATPAMGSPATRRRRSANGCWGCTPTGWA